jgi:hypothetical protein
VTATGEFTVVTELIPTCPDVFKPHAYNTPVDVIAKL